MPKTRVCPYAKGKCEAKKDEDCPKKRTKRYMTGICMRIPMERFEK